MTETWNSQSIEGSFYKHGGDHAVPEAEEKSKRAKQQTSSKHKKRQNTRIVSWLENQKNHSVSSHWIWQEQTLVQSSLFWDSSRGVGAWELSPQAQDERKPEKTHEKCKISKQGDKETHNNW